MNSNPAVPSDEPLAGARSHERQRVVAAEFQVKDDAPAPASILIVDDDRGQRSLLETFLRAQGFHTESAESGEAALEMLRKGSFAMLISDVRMPGMSGIETLRRVRQKHPALPVLLVTAFANIRSAVAAMRDGAVNYLAKPIDLDELIASVRLATERRGHVIPPARMERSVPSGIITVSPLMHAVFRDAAVIAPSETRVLITGESGVGKEVVADVIHAWSPRAKGPLVKVNCAAIPENLLESELFGHEKGAFTGAHQQRIGRFEEADGGTIFLDEIAELPPSLQAKLLRVIHDGTCRRIGSSRDLRTNARVLAATNRDLEAQIAAGKFREDLFYRLNVMELHVPPLRERPEDIVPLATHFITQFSQQPSRFSATVSACLKAYRWPGNVRELRNAMERAALLSRGEIVLPEHLPARIMGAKPEAGPAEPGDAQRLEQIEREAILKALRNNHYNRTETARELAISRRALTYKLQRLREEGVPIDPVEPES
ncbi:MAG: sigma-54-dependent Fis family transcriptional regulator [Verrucomicrobia bacterium]|nr:sigma-54-dependent Fis family transcriptional regulator [Verrucomicrobiota bacterium]